PGDGAQRLAQDRRAGRAAHVAHFELYRLLTGEGGTRAQQAEGERGKCDETSHQHSPSVDHCKKSGAIVSKLSAATTSAAATHKLDLMKRLGSGCAQEPSAHTCFGL